MNKIEAIKTIESMGEYEPFVDEPISKNSVLNIVNQINEPKKPKVPQVAIEFYERYKDSCFDLGEWFSDFYGLQVRDEFPKVLELAEWLHDNDDKTNRLREYALATLITFGPDAVEVVEDPLGVLLVDVPEESLEEYYYLYRSSEGKIAVGSLNTADLLIKMGIKVTEAEAKEKYPSFKWVSLEELEND